MFQIKHFDIQKILITLICTMLGVLLPDMFLTFLAAINVLTIGIIHGANDLYIVSKIRRTTTKQHFSYLFIIYILFVFIMVLASSRGGLGFDFAGCIMVLAAFYGLGLTVAVFFSLLMHWFC